MKKAYTVTEVTRGAFKLYFVSLKPLNEPFAIEKSLAVFNTFPEAVNYANVKTGEHLLKVKEVTEMKTKTEATPRPWKVDPIDNSVWGQLYRVADTTLSPLVAGQYQKANAELIVKAVNNFDSLLKVAKMGLECADGFFEPVHRLSDDEIEFMRETIAKAAGESK